MVLSSSDSCDLCIKEEYIACSVSAARPHHAFEFFSDCASDLCMVLTLHHIEEGFNMSSYPIMFGQSAEMMKEKGKLTSEEEEAERERERERERSTLLLSLSRV
jgi:hypothetical protein